MDKINNTKLVKEQYSTSGNLSTRISIHNKYSTNKMGFGNWIYSNYQISEGMTVLELGCGTGEMWLGHEDLIMKCSKIVISDFSEGMIEKAKATIGEYENLEYKNIDIQNIPFENKSFDVVIANMMLYHVPDLNKGLSEIRRVLKSNGNFYCATFGEHGIMEYLSKLLSMYGVEDKTTKIFTLQNGEEILKNHFDKVHKLEYKDSLAVTDVNDMVDYIYSLPSMTSLASIEKDKISSILQKNMKNGVLEVPKEYGMFVSS